MRSLRLALLVPLALTAACGSDDASQPGGITASEAQELNDAAAMLDADAVELNEVSADGNGQDARP